MNAVLSFFKWTCILAMGHMLSACASSPKVENKSADANEVNLLAVDLHRDHGWAAIRAERHDEAASYFQRILNRHEDDVDAMLGMAEARLGQDRLDDALGHFEDVSDGDLARLHGQAWQGQGIVLLRQGRREEAREALIKSLDLDQKNWRAWNALGRLRDGEKDYKAAQYAYRRAIDLQSNKAFLHNNFGFSLLASGDPVYAESSLRRALELDPEMKVATSNLRLALALQGRYQPALSGVAINERAEVFNNVGYAALLRGDLDKARSLFLNAMDVDPGFFKEARRNLAFLETLEADQSYGDRR